MAHTHPLPWWRRTLRESGYALSSLPFAVVTFSVVVAGLALGVGLTVTLLGLPVLALAAYVARGLAHVERGRLAWVRGHDSRPPAYLRSGRDDSWVRRTLTPLRDPQSWLDLLWALLSLVASVGAFVVTVAWWAVALGGLTYWIWQGYLPVEEDNVTLVELLELGEGRTAESWLYLAFGTIALVTLPWATRFASSLGTGLGSVLLSSRPAQGPVGKTTPI